MVERNAVYFCVKVRESGVQHETPPSHSSSLIVTAYREAQQKRPE